MIKLMNQINGIYSVVTRMGTPNSCHWTPYYYLTPASQVEVGCPWARGLQPQYTPRQKNTHRPTNPQPNHEPPRAQPPTIAPVTLRPDAQWK